MNIRSISNHLKPYGIVHKRKTTINHAFAAAIAPVGRADYEHVRKGMEFLGIDPENLICVYCDGHAETWDHLRGTVKNTRFSGYGHSLGNLVPCCKPCNSRKGNKLFESFLEGTENCESRVKLLTAYMEKFGGSSVSYDEITVLASAEMRRLEQIRSEIFELLAEADLLAASIRSKLD